MLKPLIFQCTRCSEAGAQSDHFLLHINKRLIRTYPDERRWSNGAQSAKIDRRLPGRPTGRARPGTPPSPSLLLGKNVHGSYMKSRILWRERPAGVWLPLWLLACRHAHRTGGTLFA